MKSSDLVEFNRLRRRLAVAVVALIAITTIGVIGYAMIGGTEHGLLDAVYMTVITLTTVGFYRAWRDGSEVAHGGRGCRGVPESHRWIADGV